MSELWSAIHLFGWRWAHGRDLVEKWVLPKTSQVVECGERLPKDIICCAVAIPIWLTRALIDRVIEDNPRVQLISFAGLMGPTIQHDMQDSVGSFHALWWPTTQSDFRIAHATDGVDDKLSHGLIQRVRNQGMIIIDRTRSEHDEQMALHQALTHAMIILHDSTPWVVKISPKTSSQTIADMMTYNPYFSKVWATFMGHINSGKNLGEAYRLCMNESDAELSTPNSEKQLISSRAWTSPPEEASLTLLTRAIQAQDGNSIETLINESRRD